MVTPTPVIAPSLASPSGSSLTVREQPDFAPPVPSVPDMPAFPDSLSLQGTVDFIKTQVLAGHPEVFWYALPDDLRNELDSAEVREVMRPSIEAQVKGQEPIREVAMKVCEILIRKKQYVLNGQMMAMAPPPMKPMIESVYDPASGIVYEVVSCAFDSNMALEHSISAYLNHYGPRIGGHLRQLAERAPAGMIDQFTNQILVNQIDDQSGTITVPNDAGGTTSVEMVAYRGRWMPKEFVEMWGQKKGTMASAMKKQADENRESTEASQQQMSVAFSMIATTADQFLQPMLDAQSQQDFDSAVMRAMTMAAMFQGNGTPGLAPAPGAQNPNF